MVSHDTTSSTPDRVRVRNNQRRARARQKEYMQDMEKKIQRHKEYEVEATKEMQEAARRVVEENVRLKAETIMLREENGRLKHLLEVQEKQDIHKQQRVAEPGMYEAPKDLKGTQSTIQPFSRVADQRILSTPEDQNFDTSSCEYAAHIITSMRADVSNDDVRQELGCGSSQHMSSCSVNSAKLFMTVDQYAS